MSYRYFTIDLIDDDGAPGCQINQFGKLASMFADATTKFASRAEAERVAEQFLVEHPHLDVQVNGRLY